MVAERGYWIHWGLYPVIVGAAFFMLYDIGKIVVGVRKLRAQGRDSVSKAG